MHSIAEKSTTTRDLIITKMYELVCDAGYKRVNMEDVAQAANVSRATVYCHFKDKEDLMMGVIRDLTIEDQNILKEIVRSRGPIKERLSRFLKSKVNLKIERCRSTHLSLDDLFSVARHRLMALRAEFLKTEAGILAELLIEGKLSGEFQFDNALTTAESFLMAMHCFMPYSLTTEELGDEDTLQSRMDAMVQMLLNSISFHSLPATRTRQRGKRSHEVTS